MHTVSFDWFLTGLEWIINLEFCLLKLLIFYQKYHRISDLGLTFPHFKMHNTHRITSNQIKLLQFKSIKSFQIKSIISYQILPSVDLQLKVPRSIKVGKGGPFFGFLTFSFVSSVHKESFNLGSFIHLLSVMLKYCPAEQQCGIHEWSLQKSSVQTKTWSTFVVLSSLSRLTHDLPEIQGTFYHFELLDHSVLKNAIKLKEYTP